MVFWHTLLLLPCTVSHCVAVFFSALLLFTVRRLSHYSSSFLFTLSLLFDKHTVVFTLYVSGGFFFTRSAVSPQMYITTVCVSSCLDGKIAVILSWGRSVFVSRLVGYWLELGGMGLFVANGVLVRHFVGVILNSSFRWLLLENYL